MLIHGFPHPRQGLHPITGIRARSVNLVLVPRPSWQTLFPQVGPIDQQQQAVDRFERSIIERQAVGLGNRERRLVVLGRAGERGIRCTRAS